MSSATSDANASSSWFVDPRTPTQRRAEVAVPPKPRAVKGQLRETRAVYRTHAGGLAVPMRTAEGQTMVEGQAVTLDGAGLFEIRQTDLTAQARRQIKGLAGSLNNASSVRCEGYADYAGTPKGAQQNAAGRAKAVCDLLATTNSGLRTTTKTYGGSWPAIVGGRADDREINRRVVVEVVDTRPALPTTPPVTPVTPHPVTPPALQVPGAPTLLRVDGYDRTVRYALTPPASDGGSPVLRYEVSLGDGWTTVTEPLGRASSAPGDGR